MLIIPENIHQHAHIHALKCEISEQALWKKNSFHQIVVSSRWKKCARRTFSEFSKSLVNAIYTHTRKKKHPNFFMISIIIFLFFTILCTVFTCFFILSQVKFTFDFWSSRGRNWLKKTDLKNFTHMYNYFFFSFLLIYPSHFIRFVLIYCRPLLWLITVVYPKFNWHWQQTLNELSAWT